MKPRVVKPRDLRKDVAEFRVVRLREVLNKMTDRHMICLGSVQPTLNTWGEYPRVTRKNLRKAIDLRGMVRLRQFCRVWLDWDPSISDAIQIACSKVATTEWTFKAQGEARRRMTDIHVEAVMAYIEEMRKP